MKSMSPTLQAAFADPEESPLARLESTSPSEVAVRRMWANIQEGQGNSSSRPRGAWFLGTFATLAVFALVFVGWHFDSKPAPLALEGSVALSAGERIVAENSERTLRFEEGSNIALSPRSELSVVSNDGPGLVFSLRRGKALFSVTPGGPRRWTVDAGEIVVRVVGTVFSVERAGEGTKVEVMRGVVTVSGAVPGSSIELRAGESVTSTSSDGNVDKRVREGVSESDSSPGDGADDSTREDRVFSLDDLEAEPEEPATEGTVGAGRDEVAQLLAEADSLRRGGRLAEAGAKLRSAVELSPPGDPRRALAALSFARLGTSPTEAAELLAQTIQDMPESLREPALGRLVVALKSSGQWERARRFASVYVSEFPTGPRADEFRREFPR